MQIFVSGIAIHRDGHKVQGDVAGLVLREPDAAALLDDVQRLAAQLVLLLIEQLRLVQQQIRQGDVLFEPFNGEADVIDQGDGGLIAHAKALVFGHCQNALRGAHHIGLHILQDFQEFGLHLVLHVVDLLNEAGIHLLAGALVKTDALAKNNRLTAIGHHRGNRIVVEYSDRLQVLHLRWNEPKNKKDTNPQIDPMSNLRTHA